MGTHKFSGTVFTSGLGGSNRKYIMGNMRYGNLKKFVEPKLFDAKTGQGEQRSTKTRRVNHLASEMDNKRYSPDTFKIGTYDNHRNNLIIDKNHVTLEVDENDKLPLLDGGHRSAALDKLASEGGEKEVIANNEQIPFLLYLDGDPKKDFVNFQEGEQVSKDHMLSVKIINGLLDAKTAPYFTIAKETAQILHTSVDSFCHNLIKFDTSSGSKLPLSLSSLSSKRASTLIFSLFGGAKIAVQHGKDSKWLSDCIIKIYSYIKENEPQLLQKGNILCPEPDGTKAGTTLLIALGNTLAAKTWLKHLNDPTNGDVEDLVSLAANYLARPVKGSTSDDAKRLIFKDVVVDYFSDLAAEDDDLKRVGVHHGIPVALISLLSPSTFDVPKLPVKPKTKGRKPKAVVTEAITYDEEEDSDSELDIESDNRPVSSYPDPDAEAFAEEDAQAAENLESLEAEAEAEDETAPWDDKEDFENSESEAELAAQD